MRFETTFDSSARCARLSDVVFAGLVAVSCALGCAGVSRVTEPGPIVPGEGVLYVHGVPIGALIELNERPVREVDEPSEMFVLPSGGYRVRISADGYLTGRHDVRVAGGEVYDLFAALWPSYVGLELVGGALQPER